MMFPHSVTVYHYDDRTGAYVRQYIQGVYWQGGGEATAANNGEEHKQVASVILSPQKTALYAAGALSVHLDDVIVRGNGSVIQSVQDLTDYAKIVSVTENVCGSTVDNIVLGVC